jgi:hypothetical protein
MASKRLDWKALEPALRKLKKEELVQVLRAAYQALPSSCVVSVFGAYVVLRRVTPRPLQYERGTASAAGSRPTIPRREAGRDTTALWARNFLSQEVVCRGKGYRGCAEHVG